MLPVGIAGGVVSLLSKIKSIFIDKRGLTLIEPGLWIALVMLAMGGAGYSLAKAMTGCSLILNLQLMR
ncbi:MAG: hypothetical protein PHQ92_11665 [Petrimonas sp.]|jgi:hypothetical protein|nr:hypothetical protein [Petrimonas sp.]